MERFEKATKDELIEALLQIESEFTSLQSELKQAKLREKILERYLQTNLSKAKLKEWEKFKKESAPNITSSRTLRTLNPVSDSQNVNGLARTQARRGLFGSPKSESESEDDKEPISASVPEGSLTISFRSSYMNFDKHLLGTVTENKGNLRNMISDFYSEWKSYQEEVAKQDLSNKRKKYFAVAIPGIQGWVLFTLFIDLEKNEIFSAKGKLEKDPSKMKWKKVEIFRLEKINTDQNLTRVLWSMDKKEDEELLQFLSPYEREDFLGRYIVYCSQLPKSNPLHYDIKSPASLKIFVGTWNMGNSTPPDDLSAWFKSGYDIYAIGVQENSKLSDEKWSSLLDKNFLEKKKVNYVRIAVGNLWAMKLNLYIRKEYLKYVTNVETYTCPTGIAKVGGNKGGIGCSFRFKNTSFCFLNCHLAAHQDRVSERNSHFRDIVGKTDVGRTNFGLLDQFTHLFWFGDLNYRIDAPLDKVLKAISHKDWPALHKNDQLTMIRERGDAFSGFHEGPIKFYPTYKFTPNTDKYDEKKGRIPSWCDRILFRSLGSSGKEGLTQTSYDSARKVRTSDHHPVYSTFEVKIQDEYRPDIHKKRVTTYITFYDLLLEIQQGHKKLGLTPQSKLSVSFFSSFAENKVLEDISFKILESKPLRTSTEQKKGKTSNLTAQFQLSCFHDDVQLLQSMTILISVDLAGESKFLSKATDHKVGQAHVSLKESIKAPREFQIPVHQQAKGVGILLGSVKINQLIEQ